MIEAEKRKAIYLLHQEGMGVNQIARLMKLSRNAVRQIIQQQGTMPKSERSDKLQIDAQLLQELYAQCEGYAQRVYEKLVEEYGIKVKYSTVTRMLRGLQLSKKEQQRCDEMPDQPGGEMQHDTSDYLVEIGSSLVRVIASLLYLRYCKLV